MTRAFSFYLALILSINAQAADVESPAALDQFNTLKALVGTWVEQGSKSKNFYIEFELTAGESVLVEKWVYKESVHSMTVYHLDQDSLLATHYCPQGNQPRLVSLPSVRPDEVNFVFKDATNLDKTRQSYQIALGFAPGADPDTLVRTETYESASGQEPSEMILARKSER